MASIVKVENLPNFWQSTSSYIERGKENVVLLAKKHVDFAKRYIKSYNRNKNSFAQDNENVKENEIPDIVKQTADALKILKQAKIPSGLFPFNAKRNEQNEVVSFVPKGKNDKEIKENILKYQEEIVEALQKGKINQEEFDFLNKNLEDLMEVNKIELDEDRDDLEITNEEIDENYDKFIAHNFGNEYNFEKLCETYQDYDLDERKACLNKFNYNLNIQLGIEGKLQFSSLNLKFENSFTRKGYILTEDAVNSQGLKQTFYAMIEMSLIRKKEIDNKQTISVQKKKQMHEKIMEERRRKYKQQKERDDKRNAAKARQRMWNA